MAQPKAAAGEYVPISNPPTPAFTPRKSGAESPSANHNLISPGSSSHGQSGFFSPPVAPFARHSRPASVHSFYSDSPYGGPGTRQSSVVEKFSLGPDPRQWGTALTPDLVEDDDDLHAVPTDPKRIERDGGVFSARGLANLGCMAVLILGLLTLFAGYPIISHFTKKQQSTFGAFNVGGTNATGQVPEIAGGYRLIDKDTPKTVYSKASWNGKEDMNLVFSDEFNVDGRTFYPGDDPYWEAVDLHYWPTNNLEWYDPAQVKTSGGSLVITLEPKDPGINHNLSYVGGMIASWNKFCFTGGYIEASVMLPGVNDIVGLWPAVWTMGNLGRAGYGASTEGTWPYNYDACDVGTYANQSVNGMPAAVLTGNDQYSDGLLSFLPGQRYSACTCLSDADLHPGPKHKDGTLVGRSAPEIDIFEAQVGHVTKGKGEVSQSAQWAPYNIAYQWPNATNMIVEDPKLSEINSYTGGVYQMATSVITQVNQDCYEKTGQCFSVYGFEYKPGFDDAYITWVTDNKKVWTLLVGGLQADPVAEVSARPMPQEPMYILVNLGMSRNFGAVDLDHLPFPVHLAVDYIRVYQPKSAINIGCDPAAFPTSKFIEQNMDAYNNPNYTTWQLPNKDSGLGKPFPKNSWVVNNGKPKEC